MAIQNVNGRNVYVLAPKAPTGKLQVEETGPHCIQIFAGRYGKHRKRMKLKR
jgi:hypothetical protein